MKNIRLKQYSKRRGTDKRTDHVSVYIQCSLLFAIVLGIAAILNVNIKNNNQIPVKTVSTVSPADTNKLEVITYDDEASGLEGDPSDAIALINFDLRSGPGAEYSVVGTVEKNTRLKVKGFLNNNDAWAQVESPNGKSGWCCTYYIQSETEDGTAAIDLEGAVYPLYIRVSLDEQRVKVFDANEQNIKTFICSSGKSGYETPTGTFSISDRGLSFYNSQLQEGAYYWTSFYGEYLFHSIPFDQNYEIEEDEAKKLGVRASHGCIRLAVEDAKWIYDHIQNGTKVIIN